MSRRCASVARASSHFRFALRHVQRKSDRAAAAAGTPRHLDDDGVRAPRAQLSRARPSKADVCKAECRRGNASWWPAQVQQLLRGTFDNH